MIVPQANDADSRNMLAYHLHLIYMRTIISNLNIVKDELMMHMSG